MFFGSRFVVILKEKQKSFNETANSRKHTIQYKKGRLIDMIGRKKQTNKENNRLAGCNNE